MDYQEQLHQLALESGCAGFGVTAATAFAGVAETLAERSDSGMAGKLRFTYTDPERAADVRRSFPWARRLIVLSWSYLPEAGNPGPPGPRSGRVARFATQDHYEGLRHALDVISRRLRSDGWQAEVVVDDNRLVDRAAAVRAGVGWWGKSAMILDPRHGPWLLIGSVVTDAPVETTPQMARDCGTCDACIPACPTDAILAPGVLDASRCIAHWTQVAGVIPRSMRAPMGDRVYGCDECLDACPPGGKLVATAARQDGRVDLHALLAADDASLLESYSHFYIPRRKPRFLRRNALVALGNATAAARSNGTAEAHGLGATMTVLAEYLQGSDEICRIHAAWALGRTGDPAAPRLLQSQLAVETSAAVTEEIRLALADLGEPPE
ncbi:MAG: tRNA epoxyqueuosine(34) reductase QueG [Acidimicrobiia bacterium]|nr:tRNA epoxyqueuosine(34) reductase QueG [Acidimicrobiia bacterium]